MASPSIASYFNVRKRAAADDIVNTKNKVIRLDDTADGNNAATVDKNILNKNKLVDADLKTIANGATSKIFEASAASISQKTTKPAERKVAKRAATKRNAIESSKVSSNQPKIVKFTLAGTLSPQKKSSNGSTIFQPVGKNANVEKLSTPTKKDQQVTPVPSGSASKAAAIVNKNLTNAKRELSFDEIKNKVTRSSKLQHLKEILNKHQQLEEQYQACINKRNAKLKAANSPDKQTLKQFESIELEVLTR